MVELPSVSFRRVTAGDFKLLGGWLAEPHVHRWWHQEHTAEAIEKDFGPATRGEEPSEDLIVLADHRPLGLIQRCRLADYPEDLVRLRALVDVPDEAHTIDYLIGDSANVGHGIGPQIIAAAVVDLFASHQQATCVIVAVAAGNRASWRALEKAGFAYVGEGELPPDNPVDDGHHVIYQLDRASPAPTTDQADLRDRIEQARVNLADG